MSLIKADKTWIIDDESFAENIDDNDRNNHKNNMKIMKVMDYIIDTQFNDNYVFIIFFYF